MGGGESRLPVRILGVGQGLGQGPLHAWGPAFSSGNTEQGPDSSFVLPVNGLAPHTHTWTTPDPPACVCLSTGLWKDLCSVWSGLVLPSPGGESWPVWQPLLGLGSRSGHLWAWAPCRRASGSSGIISDHSLSWWGSLYVVETPGPRLFYLNSLPW